MKIKKTEMVVKKAERKYRMFFLAVVVVIDLIKMYMAYSKGKIKKTMPMVFTRTDNPAQNPESREYPLH